MKIFKSFQFKRAHFKRHSLMGVVAALILSGCGKIDVFTAQYTGKPAHICEEGVTYLQFSTGATVMVDRQGKPVSCN